MKTLAMTPLQIFPAGAVAQQAAALEPGPEVPSADAATAKLVAQIQAVIPGIFTLPPVTLMADRLLIPDTLPLAPTRRLVVLVPPGSLDEIGLARRIWQLAESSGLSVLYLTVAPAAADVALQRRRLAELASMTTGKDVHARSLVSVEKNWPQAVEKTLYSGDLLVCLAGHRMGRSLVRQVSLGEHLVNALAMPVYVLGGLPIGSAPEWRRRSKAVQAWVSSLVLMAVFFALEVRIDHTVPRPVASLVICLVVLFEFFVLMRINDWIG